MKCVCPILLILAVAGCSGTPPIRVTEEPLPKLSAPMSATQLRAYATRDGVDVPAHKEQVLISGLEAAPTEPLVKQEAFWVVSQPAVLPAPVVADPEPEKRQAVKKVAKKAPKKPVKYVCKPVGAAK